ncbi:hypothetical protein [Cellulomonas sp. SLBN-39]|uniref:hypothetical protein n=1 Tax=Cellulomonas sp. SLBN-39 TaxID=2768446 RepID=UPI0011522A1B|nr:hypothetical protein [Cellulomonas sp. SLBN-39]
MDTLPDVGPDLRRREIAVRRAEGVLLRSHAVGVAVLAAWAAVMASNAGAEPQRAIGLAVLGFALAGVMPAFVYGAAWWAVRAGERSRRTSGGGAGLGVAAVVGLVLVPLQPALALPLGAFGMSGLLGLGIVALGLHRRSRLLWGAGAGVVALHLLVWLVLLVVGWSAFEVWVPVVLSAATSVGLGACASWASTQARRSERAARFAA